LICFGDSISDDGNTFAYTHSAWPISMSYPKHVFTDQATWVKYLADLRKDSKNVEKAVTMNYALGSATSDNFFIQGYTGPESTWPVSGAVQQFEMFQLETNQTGFYNPKKQQAVYFVLIGVNDVYFQWAAGKDPKDSEFLGGIATNIGNIVDHIVKNEVAHGHKGYRVVVANAYPIETVPFAYYYPGQLDGITETFNKLLSSEVEAKQKAYPDVEIHEFDLSSVIYGIIEDAPASVSTITSCIQGDYFKGTQVVCKDPKKFVYYDSFHPSSWVHQEIAKQVNKLLG